MVLGSLGINAGVSDFTRVIDFISFHQADEINASLVWMNAGIVPTEQSHDCVFVNYINMCIYQLLGIPGHNNSCT